MNIRVRLDESLLPENAKTLKTYYDSVEKGAFLNILDTLSDDIEYVISGNPAILPFAGVWSGKERVTELFKTFGSAFQLLALNENLVMQSSDRVISANDESFMVWNTARYYRVPVLHIAEFGTDHRIRRFINIHDTSTAEQAFAGENSSLVAILPKPEGKEAAVKLDEAGARTIASDLVAILFGDGAHNAAEKFPNLRLFIPGLPSRDLVSGVWAGAGLEKVYPLQAEAFRRMRLPDATALIDTITVSHGQIAIEGRFKGIVGPWAITAQLDSKGVSAAALFIDFPAF